MAHATIEEIKAQTSFDEVSALPDSKLNWYVDRANSWIRRATGFDYSGETRESIKLDLKIATILLVELIWLKDNPEVKESELSNLSSERIGSYSYNLAAKPGSAEGTGSEELDSILKSLRVGLGASFFSVSGPSRVKARPYGWIDYDDI